MVILSYKQTNRNCKSAKASLSIIGDSKSSGSDKSSASEPRSAPTSLCCGPSGLSSGRQFLGTCSLWNSSRKAWLMSLASSCSAKMWRSLRSSKPWPWQVWNLHSKKGSSPVRQRSNRRLDRWIIIPSCKYRSDNHVSEYMQKTRHLSQKGSHFDQFTVKLEKDKAWEGLLYIIVI